MRTLPAQESIKAMRLACEAKAQLIFTDDEIKAFGLTMGPETASWEKNEEAQIYLSEPVRKFIAGILMVLSADKQITAELIPLWDAFVGETDETA